MSKANPSFWRQQNTRPLTGLPMLLASGGCFAAALSWTWISYRRALQQPLPSAADIAALDTVAIWRDKDGSKYEDDIVWTEWWGGILKKRRQLVRRAEGHVLESAAGTARNRGMYDERRVKTVTFVDQSRGMLEKAKERWWETDNLKRNHKIKARFMVGDLGRDNVDVLKPERGAEENKSAEDELEKFDTVVQTMGLCSTPDPVKILRNLGGLVKKDGKILLLEHGKSHYGWVNEVLDRTCIGHAKRHGCWWNRDIKEIVKESGLEVEQEARYNFGTLYWFILRPSIKPPPLPSPASASSDEPSKQLQPSWKSWKIW